jgi:hypothetical protein
MVSIFNFGGTPNNQGVELKTYVLVVRGFTTSTGTGATDPIPLPRHLIITSRFINFSMIP